MDYQYRKELLKKKDFRPNKKLGQNFMIDKNVRENILRYLPLDDNTTVVEIGSGFGVMSFDIAARCGHLYAVEKDARICEIMAPFFEEDSKTTLIESDILDIDLSLSRNLHLEQTILKLCNSNLLLD